MPAGCRWSSVEVCAVNVAGEAGDVGFLHAVGSLAPPPGKRLAVAPPLLPAALALPPYPAAPPRDERPLRLLLRPPMTAAGNRKRSQNTNHTTGQQIL